MILNLDVSEQTKTWDPTDPSGTSSFSTALNVFDTLGQSHQIQVYFNKTDDQTWEWHAMIDGGDVQGGTAGVLEDYGSGTIGFDSDGALTTTMPATFSTGSIVFANGISAGATTLDLTGTTQYGFTSAVQSIVQDGYSAGMVTGITIDGDGNIVASFSNGMVKNIARLAIADFTNVNGLAREGSSLYRSTPEAGQPLLNKPGVGGMGTVSSATLEQSNVDIAAEFIRMIIVQRGYQANSKVISTTDDMLAQLMNIR
jgi:flagellar hook protein FlgE